MTRFSRFRRGRRPTLEEVVAEACEIAEGNDEFGEREFDKYVEYYTADEEPELLCQRCEECKVCHECQAAGITLDDESENESEGEGESEGEEKEEAAEHAERAE